MSYHYMSNIDPAPASRDGLPWYEIWMRPKHPAVSIILRGHHYEVTEDDPLSESDLAPPVLMTFDASGLQLFVDQLREYAERVGISIDTKRKFAPGLPLWKRLKIWWHLKMMRQI